MQVTCVNDILEEPILGVGRCNVNDLFHCLGRYIFWFNLNAHRLKGPALGQFDDLTGEGRREQKGLT